MTQNNSKQARARSKLTQNEPKIHTNSQRNPKQSKGIQKET